MKLSLELAFTTPQSWATQVMNDFPYFLQDHADCERKASSMALSFVAKCPDKIAIIPELIETALEELEHFQQVYQIMQKRGIRLRSEMPKDQYIQELIGNCRSGMDDRLLDRMLVASIVECRGAERFKLIAEELTELELKDFYKALWISEAKHGHIFVKFALNYWNKTAVYQRLAELNNIEAEICSKMEWTPRLH